MKNLIKFVGIAALAAVIGLSMAACLVEVPIIDSEGPVEIIVWNNSISDSPMFFIRTGTGQEGIVASGNVPFGGSLALHCEEGQYYIEVGPNTARYPAATNTREEFKAGKYELNYNGSSLVKADPFYTPPAGTKGTLVIDNDLSTDDSITNIVIYQGTEKDGTKVFNDSSLNITPNASKSYPLEPGVYYVDVTDSSNFNRYAVVNIYAGEITQLSWDDDFDDPSSYTFVSVNSVTFSTSAMSLNVGDAQWLTATVAPSNATIQELAWKSSNTAVATVSSGGMVTAKAGGTATISATTKDGSNKTATCTVTVTANGTLKITNNIPTLTGLDPTEIKGFVIYTGTTAAGTPVVNQTGLSVKYGDSTTYNLKPGDYYIVITAGTGDSIYNEKKFTVIAGQTLAVRWDDDFE